MRGVFKAALIPLFAIAAVAAFDPSWSDSPFPQWSADDARQLLADSPWVKKVQLDKVGNLSMFARRDGGDLNAGIPSGIGIATLGLLADWRDIEMAEHQFAVANLGSVAVRWESALPVRAAEMKVGEADFSPWTDEYYAIAVHDIRPPFRWNLANELKGVASIKRMGKRDFRPARVVVVPRADGLVTLAYLFPRSVEITKKDKTVAFVAQIGRLYVSVNFFPEDMRLQGQLEL